MLPHDPPYRLQAVPRVHMPAGLKTEELELKKMQQETKAIETSRKAIPSMWQEMCKKQLMIANSDFMENMEKKFLNLVSKLKEKDNVITTFMLSAQQFAEVKRKEMEQGTFPVKHVPERRIVTVTVSIISGETWYEAGDNMMNYSTGNKTTTLININDVPHNVGEGFLHARTSRQTITTTTTVTPHMSKARQVLGDNRDNKVSISRNEYSHQQASKYCSS
ncbi:hypothetical protein KY285_001190 [Solanum tuberosum]|nr:hypothetical protein KY285_001190 [Solanum tuberosum]